MRDRRFIKVDILRCKRCRSLTIAVGGRASCPKGCGGWYDTVSTVKVLREDMEAGLAIHGQTCPKATHIGGDLHEEDWDKPYSVDGVYYCGRCHIWMDQKEAEEALA